VKFSLGKFRQESCESIACGDRTFERDVQLSQDMDQRMIVAYLDLKGMSARAIQENLGATLGANAVAYSSVMHYLREARCLRSRSDPPPVEIEREVDDADRVISFTLSRNPFASVRRLSRLTSLLPTTVSRRLTQSLGYTVGHLRWVPHVLSGAQRVDRVSLSEPLLGTLEVQRDLAWHDIVTITPARMDHDIVMQRNQHSDHKMQQDFAHLNRKQQSNEVKQGRHNLIDHSRACR
jgi:hypothetical protein